MSWDAFICHASEDKESFVSPLADELHAKGLNIWYDEFTLRVGDSLRRTIDRGLAESDYGIVVLSPDFFNKEWPQRELDGLAAREINERKVILPIWHNISRDEVARHSPTLADRYATISGRGVSYVVNELLQVIRPEPPSNNSTLAASTERLEVPSAQDALQALTKGDFINYARNKEPGIDWDTFGLAAYEQARRLFVTTMGQLAEAIEDRHAREELDEIYRRLLGRQADWIGIFMYQPVIFLSGPFGRQLVEQAVLASREYRERKTGIDTGSEPVSAQIPVPSSQEKLQELEKLMPDLIAEMRQDVLGDDTKLVREFRVMIRPDFPLFGGSSPRQFAYYEETHADLRNMLSLLNDAGFIWQVTFEQFPIYRMTDDFINFLRQASEARL